MNTNFEPISEELERLAKIAVNAAYQVHSTLGPGLLESVYEVCMMYEFAKVGIKAERQLPVPVLYDGVLLLINFNVPVIKEGIKRIVYG